MFIRDWIIILSQMFTMNQLIKMAVKLIHLQIKLIWINSLIHNKYTEKNDSLNLLNFFKVSGRNQFILATFK